MRKLKLELDELFVETFTTDALEVPTGTVHGYQSLGCSRNLPDGPTCNEANTCGGDTCDGLYTCNYLSCDINCGSYKCDDTVIATGCL